MLEPAVFSLSFGEPLPVYNWISDREYTRMHAQLPILCVDVVATSGECVLLIKRLGPPAAGKWWFPGGRLRRGESSARASQRIGVNEAGIDTCRPIFIGVVEMSFKKDAPFPHGLGTHTVSLIYAAEATTIDVQLDDSHAAFQWWNPKLPGPKDALDLPVARSLAVRALTIPAVSA